jgi:hypothetical protein
MWQSFQTRCGESGRELHHDKFIFSACGKLLRSGNDCYYKSHTLDNSQRTLVSSRSIILNIKQTRNNIYYAVRSPAGFCSPSLLSRDFIHPHHLTDTECASEAASHVMSSGMVRSIYEEAKTLIRLFNCTVSHTTATAQ